MNHEFVFSQEGKIVKRLRLFSEKNKSVVEEVELRPDYKNNEAIWYPVYVNVHDKFMYARTDFLGRLAQIGYEHANNTNDPDLRNMFSRANERF